MEFTSKTVIKTSPIHRFGVFAAQDLKNNELVENCLALTIPEEPTHGNILEDYTFRTGKKDQVCLLLGGGSVYNHSDTPNVEICASSDDIDDVHEVWTKRAIKKGEELYISYGKAYWNWGPRKRKKKRTEQETEKSKRVKHVKRNRRD